MENNMENNMIERTLSIIKPDATRRSLTDKINAKLRLRVCALLRKRRCR